MNAEFHHSQSSRLRQYLLEVVLSWLEEDMQYVKDNQAPPDGTAQALQATVQAAFDAVLIDGSWFTGVPEFNAIYSATFISNLW